MLVVRGVGRNARARSRKYGHRINTNRHGQGEGRKKPPDLRYRGGEGVQLGVDAAGVPYSKTITMVAEHPWQNSVDHCSNEARRCNEREEKVVTRRGGGCIEMEVQGGGED